MTRARALLILVALLVVSFPAFAASPQHELSAQVGVPIPLSVYGRRALSGDSDVGFLMYGEARYGYYLKSVPTLSLGAWAEGSIATGESGGANGKLYFVSGGPEVGLLVVPVSPKGLVVGVSAGLGILLSGVISEGSIRKDTVSIGLRVRGRVGTMLTKKVSLDLVVGFAIYSWPLDEATWFNDELRETRLLTVGVGLSWWGYR